MIGINLSGAEFGSGFRHGSDYHYPDIAEIRHYKDAGIGLMRLPFTWERMQSHLGGPLENAELGRLKQFLADADAVGVKVVIDLHNYGRYNGQTIGSANGPTNAQFADFWAKLASAVKDAPALVAYDIMNEPHDMGGAGIWKSAAQAAVNAIRSVDMETQIHIEGDGWSGAHHWLQNNADLILNDPGNNLVYSAHQYFDRHSEGIYRGSYDAEGAYSMVGVDRIKPFVEWLKANNLKGFLGEFGVPSNDARWIEVQKNVLDYMKNEGLSGTAWGGGFWWPSDYPMFMGTSSLPATAFFNLLKNHADDGGSPWDAASNPAPSSGNSPSADQAGVGNNGELAPNESGNWGNTGPTDAGPSEGFGSTETGAWGDDVFNGSSGEDRIDAGEGNDVLNGTGGADELIGGAGDDLVSYHWSGAAVDVDLARATQKKGDAQGDRLIGIERVGGSAHGDTLAGDDGNNVLDGRGGDDVINGRGGADVLTGGWGNDRFVFDSARDANGDRVTDWSGGDVLDFSAIDANEQEGGNQSFTNIGEGWFTHVAGQLRVYIEYDHILIAGDVNGDGYADFTVTLDSTYSVWGLIL